MKSITALYFRYTKGVQIFCTMESRFCYTKAQHNCDSVVRKICTPFCAVEIWCCNAYREREKYTIKLWFCCARGLKHESTTKVWFCYKYTTKSQICFDFVPEKKMYNGITRLFSIFFFLEKKMYNESVKFHMAESPFRCATNCCCTIELYFHGASTIIKIIKSWFYCTKFYNNHDSNWPQKWKKKTFMFYWGKFCDCTWMLVEMLLVLTARCSEFHEQDYVIFE